MSYLNTTIQSQVQVGGGGREGKLRGEGERKRVRRPGVADIRSNNCQFQYSPCVVF